MSYVLPWGVGGVGLCRGDGTGGGEEEEEGRGGEGWVSKNSSSCTKLSIMSISMYQVHRKFNSHRLLMLGLWSGGMVEW